MRKRISGILAAVLLIGCILVGWPQGAAQPQRPEHDHNPLTPAVSAAQVPQEETTPPEMEPETQPPETQPPETIPPETAPPESLPETTEMVPDPQGQTGTVTEPSPTAGTEPTIGPGEDPGPGPTGPEEGEEVQIVTDLTSRLVDTVELPDGVLPFYAYLVGANSQMSLKVNLRNSQTSSNGVTLQGQGRDYQAPLTLGRNFITLYIKEGNRTVSSVRYTITYEAEKASAQKPTVGQNPPSIWTNLDGWEGEITNQEFTFKVEAKTWQGQPLRASNVLVTVDGKTVFSPTGSDILEYALHFDNPIEGETEQHIITALAWDGEGNSRFVTYTVLYRAIGAGLESGTVRIVVDATTVGLNVILDETCKIISGEPISYVVCRALEEADFIVEYDGTLDDRFYLRRIFRGDMAKRAKVPDSLWEKILADGLSLTNQKNRDSLGERDYTYDSGWMYSRDGVGYEGRSMSAVTPNDGETIYIRFTLAQGKDIGGGGGTGWMTSYCGTWLFGSYQEQHTYGQEQVLREPTCTEAGSYGRRCQVEGCGHEDAQPYGEPLGHDEAQTGRQEPAEGVDGYVEYTCRRCGQVRREVLPALPPVTDPDPTDPDPTNPQWSRRKKRSRTALMEWR